MKHVHKRNISDLNLDLCQQTFLIAVMAFMRLMLIKISQLCQHRVSLEGQTDNFQHHHHEDHVEVSRWLRQAKMCDTAEEHEVNHQEAEDDDVTFPESYIKLKLLRVPTG